MQLTPIVAIHMTSALGAIAIGPIALWARKGAVQRPKLHRAFGYAWVTLMMMAATSAIFIPSEVSASFGRFSWIHLLIPVTYGMLIWSFWNLAKGNIAVHRKAMHGLYLGACVVAGVFTLQPPRYLGQLIWHQWLGLI